MKTPKGRHDNKSAVLRKGGGRENWPWLTAVGAVAMFVSWIFQNQFAAGFTEERLALERTQPTIDLAQLRMEQWEILYLQEKAKPNPDRNILLTAAFKTLQARLNLEAGSSARRRKAESEAAKDISEKNEVQESLAERYKSGDLEWLEKDLQQSAAISNEFNLGGIENEDFGEKLARARQLEHWFTVLFVSTFALGSFAAAWDYVRRIRRAIVVAATEPKQP